MFDIVSTDSDVSFCLSCSRCRARVVLKEEMKRWIVSTLDFIYSLHQHYYPKEKEREKFLFFLRTEREKKKQERIARHTVFCRRYFRGCSSVDVASILDKFSSDMNCDI